MVSRRSVSYTHLSLMSEIIWDLALIQKYNQSGPRYTSYPTALEFNESYTNEDFIAAANRYPERPLSLYVHIPFCHKLCYFCGCNKVITRHQHKADIYLDYLEKEIKARSELFKNRVRLKCIGAVVHRLI